MNKRLRFIATVLFFGMIFYSTAYAQQGYSNFREITNRLQNLASQYNDIARLESLAKSPGGHDIWLLTIGTGDVSSKSALAVIGGVNGKHILGTELATQFAEKLLNHSSSDSIQTLLQHTTFYIMPAVNPDAGAQYFADLRYERMLNATKTDNDRDGLFDEDGYEDLNGDGLITMMRIKNGTDEWTPLEKDNRIMVKANNKENKWGDYRLVTEGTDDDNDGSFNEDGAGGVNINKNFTFDYPYFTPGAGENMASQPETRAIMDFLYVKGQNVFAVVSFGPENNLSNPLKFNSAAVSKRVITGWFKEDIAINERISGMYKSMTGLEGAPDSSPQPGSLFQWAYFHYGRFSFSAPGWCIPEIKGEDGNPINYDSDKAHYLAWAEPENIDPFVDWQQIDHPGFPNKIVEVGGIKPYSMHTPPYTAVDSLATQHTAFLIALAGMHPQIKLKNFKIEKAGDRLTRITVDVTNTGKFPTVSALGERNRWVREVNLKLDLSNGLHIISGQIYQSFDTIKADEKKTVTWLISGEGTVSIKAGAPSTGFSTIEKTI